MCGFIAQLVEHRTGIAEVMGSNPVEALIFFRLLLSNCLNWKIYCDDHTSLSEVDLSDTNQQRGRQTRPKHHTYKDHVYFDRLFLLSNLTWRRAHAMADWKGFRCETKCFAAFSLKTKSMTLICIYGDCKAILLFTSRKINLDFCSAFVESSYIQTNGLFQYQTRITMV